MSAVVIAVLLAILIKSAGEITLLSLSLARVRTLRRGPIPPQARECFADEDAFRKAMDYSAAKTRDGLLGELWTGALAIIMVLGGAAALHGVMASMFGSGGVWKEALAAIVFFMTLGLLEAPISLMSTFGTETRFGFNRTNPGLWVIDQLKGLAVGVTLAFALLTPCAWFLQKLPGTWWMFAWIAFVLFRFLAAGLLSVVLLPLFQKLTPLEDGPLKQGLLELARKADFPASAILVMDGSRRSAHANAFFAGFGRMRRIVLFDTLVAQLSREELEAVLAHEIGHWKRGHILKGMVVSTLVALPLFGLAGWISARPDLAVAFGYGIAPDATHTPFGALLPLLALALAPVLYWLSPLANGISRKHEFEADAYAAGLTGGPDALVRALTKLYSANSSNPLPHPAYALFHHSHPSLPERKAALTTTR